MSLNPTLKNDKIEDPTVFKITTKDDDIKGLKFKTDKHDNENVIKSFKGESKFRMKKYKSLIKKIFNICD